MSWHTKYRPSKARDIHQEVVREKVLKLMKSGRFPQVFLFSGPKGTGKTTLSRIIAAILNSKSNQKAVEEIFSSQKSSQILSEPDENDEQIQKIIQGKSYLVREMDAASNRGIDDVRQLKELANIPPATAQVSVFILDEAHMLTKEAFNALLKLLEEPPAHAVFILATTEAEKIPDTVRSRCTIIDFSQASDDEIAKALQNILDQEKIEYEESAIIKIAKSAGGSFRDAIKLMEVALANEKKLTSKLIDSQKNLSLINEIKNIINFVINKDAAGLAEQFLDLRKMGVNERDLLSKMLDFLHQDLMISLGVLDGNAEYDQKVSLYLLNHLNQISLKESPISLLNLELALLNLIEMARNKGGKGGQIPNPESRIQNSKSIIGPNLEAQAEILSIWDKFVADVFAQNSTVGAFLRSAKPIELTDGIAKVAVFYKFHQDQLSSPKFAELYAKASEPLTGQRTQFEFVLEEAHQEDGLSALAGSELL